MDSYREQLENSLGLPMVTLESENAALPGMLLYSYKNFFQLLFRYIL